MSPYYPTLREDIDRAKQILENGKAEPLTVGDRTFATGGTIYGADVAAAYKLLESFVEELERRHPTTSPTHDDPPVELYRSMSDRELRDLARAFTLDRGPLLHSLGFITGRLDAINAELERRAPGTTGPQ